MIAVNLADDTLARSALPSLRPLSVPSLCPPQVRDAIRRRTAHSSGQRPRTADLAFAVELRYHGRPQPRSTGSRDRSAALATAARVEQRSRPSSRRIVSRPATEIAGGTTAPGHAWDLPVTGRRLTAWTRVRPKRCARCCSRSERPSVVAGAAPEERARSCATRASCRPGARRRASSARHLRSLSPTAGVWQLKCKLRTSPSATLERRSTARRRCAQRAPRRPERYSIRLCADLLACCARRASRPRSYGASEAHLQHLSQDAAQALARAAVRLRAVRVVSASIPDCYCALGNVHVHGRTSR